MVYDDAIIRDLMRMINDKSIEPRTRNKLRGVLAYVRSLEEDKRRSQ